MGSLSPASPEVSTSFYNREDFQNNPRLTQEVVDVINTAFRTHSENIGFHKHEDRFSTPAGLPEMLGPHGICAVARIDNIIGATGALIPWRPKVGGIIDDALKLDRPDDFALAETGNSYEVKTVTTVEGPTTARKGLASRIVDALIVEGDKRHPGEDVLLWVQIAEEQAGPYWRKRGYERVGPIEIKPAGTWSSENPFQFLTLVKRVKGTKR